MNHWVIIVMAVFVYIAIVKDALVGYLIYLIYEKRGMEGFFVCDNFHFRWLNNNAIKIRIRRPGRMKTHGQCCCYEPWPISCYSSDFNG